MFFPDVMIDFPNEPPEAHPQILNSVRDPVVTYRMIHHSMPVSEEFGDIFIPCPGIGTHQG